MTLPPAFLDELRSRVSLSRIVGRKVTWDLRKSNQGKGDMWAPCPFHQERSASFHVDDAKGFYYCFGCHAKGNAITFLMESENMGFREAVEALAREAGMTMPARDPDAVRIADRATLLVQVMEEAVKHYRLQLQTGAGAAARAYLARRGLGQAGQDRFEIGFAPPGRQGLLTALAQKGIPPDLIRDAGLSAAPDDGGAPYDTFRDRIIFPIRDARGRAISFGGRAMDPNARAKYLNGPATTLFDKGRSLYNHGPARAAAGKGKPLILAEGYMDVIALSEAGFTATVAPLGTAVTAEQLDLLWRIHPEPVVALDGDKAGLAAALRVVDLALPLLQAGQGLRFAILPPGLDPDDLIRAQGAGAMQAVLDAAQPMIGLLWQRETEGRVFDSPERKAMLEKTLRTAIDRIKDPSIRSHYTAEAKRLQWEMFARRPAARPAGTPTARSPGRRAPDIIIPPTPVTRASALGLAGTAAVEEQVLEAVLLATLIVHPALIVTFESALESIDLSTPDHDTLRRAVLRHAAATDTATFRAGLGVDLGAVLETLFAQSHVSSAPPVRKADDPELARMCVAEGLAKLEARRGSRREIEDAMQDMTGLVDEGLTWRLAQSAGATHDAARSRLEDAAEMGEDRASLSRHLQNLIDGEIWVKKKG